ncbi:MAG: M6 family metalloprotease domain-containing protein [Bacteroidales bacterium]|nr:M6 family metalloprotease domain-containing protein [Bacteroidales bacterium]
MKRAILCVLAFFFAWNMLMAVPAIKKPITVKQADGTTITIYLRGDENTKWHESLDGYSLMKVENQFYYAVLDKDGNMVASKVKAHNQDQRTRQEKKLLRKTPQKLRYSPQQLSEMRAKGPVALANSPARTLANSPLAKAFKARKTLTETVVRRAPIILVNFADRQMTTPKENYDELVNATNYTKNGCTGSFRDYFLDNSRGLFRFEADVIGPVTLSKNMAYYGGNNRYGEDSNPQGMAAEACRLASESGVDFSQYDFDNDGIVDGVHIIFPGKGEETSDEEDAIWSHMWNVDENVNLDGKKLDVYSCSAEFSYWGDWACIGTLVHELSHVFGLPDLYDSDYEDNGGEAVTPGGFDVMDDGSYNNKSKTPPLHNAWSRIQMGWLDEVELTEACRVELFPAQEATQAFYYNTPVEGEYFVLDYRGEESKWDKYIPGFGMLIFAVNENVKYYGESAWEYNCANCNPSNRGFYIKQANGGKNSDSYMNPGTPFPGKSNKTSFTDETVPASTSHSGQKTNKPITEIEEMEEGGVSFVFIGKSDTIRDNLGNMRISNDPVPVRMPVFSPAGGTVTPGTKVTITSATQDAVIYYTQDGSDPSAASTRYSSPVAINKDVTLKAIALKDGMEDSKIATAKFTVKEDEPTAERVASPVFSPKAGTVEKGTKVTISTATAGATIFYTTDGSEPSFADKEYVSPITIDRTMTLKAIASKEEMQDSKVVTAQYTIAGDPNVANESEENAGIKVYPNPNNGNFYLELPENAEVSVFGMNGSLLRRQKLETGLHEMSIDQSGTYVLRVDTGKASVSKRVTVR